MKVCALGSTCPDCDGDGEVYVGSSVPGDEGYGPCYACEESGKLPTLRKLRAIREKLEQLEEDKYVDAMEIELWKERAGELEARLREESGRGRRNGGLDDE